MPELERLLSTPFGADPAQRPNPESGTAAGAEPETAVGAAWIGRFSLAWLGFWMANLVPLQLLIPDQLAAITPQHKVAAFALLNVVSGVVALVALPICGMLCDHSRNRFGRRRSWIAGGTVLFAAGLVLTGTQHSVAGLTAVWSVSMLGLSAVTAALTAVVADRVPERQRGTVSSAIFGPQALGVVLGIAVVSALDLTSLQGYLVIAVASVALTAPMVLRYREVAPDTDATLTLRAVAGGLRVDLRSNPDFGWAFAGRLLVNLGNSLGTCYLLYFLTDALRVPDPDQSLLLLTVLYLLAGLAATYVFGWLSDRLARRRIFVLVAALLQAVAGFLLALSPTFGTAAVAATLMGGGFGAYMAVDQALVTRVLPDAQTRAKDLGIMNIGTIVPPTLAPLVAGGLITSDGQGYTSLFTLVGVIALVGAVLVYRVRSVR